MKKLFFLPTDVAKDAVTKVEFESMDSKITSQGLHFVPPSDKPLHEAIGSHAHTEDSERYYKLQITKDDKGKIVNFEWIPLDPVSASTPDCNTHSVQSSNEIQIIFGVKRSSKYNKNNWPEDDLPKVNYNKDYDLFRFKLGDDTIYTHSDFQEILSEEDAKIYIAPNSRSTVEEEEKNPEVNNYIPAKDDTNTDITINTTAFSKFYDDDTSR